MTTHRDYWQPHEDDTVRRMWKQGDPAGKISLALGGTRSRNAVLDRVQRLRLNARADLPVRPPPPRWQPPEAYTAGQYVAGTSSGCFRCGAARPAGCTC